MAKDGFWAEVGSIVGVGVGGIELMLIKRHFTPGEIVHGRVQLALARDTEAKRLVVGLLGVRERVVERRRPDGARARDTERDEVFRFEQELGGKRVYKPGEGFDLHLAVPADVSQKPAYPSGTLGEVARFLTTMVGPQPVRWSVYAMLDIPWKANMRKGLDVTVG